MKLHVAHWKPCSDRFVFFVFEECGYGAHYAQYVLLSHLPVHVLRGRTIVFNKNSFFGSREVSMLFAHEHLAQACYEYSNTLIRGGQSNEQTLS